MPTGRSVNCASRLARPELTSVSGPGLRLPRRQLVDLGLHRLRCLASELLLLGRGRGVSFDARRKALLEMGVNIARHQLVVPAGGVPIGPVMGKLHDHAEAARALEQLVDIGDRVIWRADTG